MREGESTSLRCTVPAGTPLSSITWTRASGANLAQVTRVDSGLVLAIQAASAETTDLYACTVVDVSGNSVVRTIAVQVLSKNTSNIQLSQLIKSCVHFATPRIG